MLYVIHAYDFTDEQAHHRRMAVRERHIAGAKLLKSNGNFVLGGALLDLDGKMIGSMMLVDFEEEAQLHHWLENDPYVTGNVWDKIDVKPFKMANI
ncbi:YciI family protein [Runella slithyformis]|uniref:YCII-related protein n=1 Tax=Runella slithyformis (strain ATCC 29530 / DSM 19594 / LMG 11500 / NCIMB 11436 / LSU 4) TaxID=761193 RepID=A0A7U3ZLQ2_RUNSL|nr:YciI family protein [Runella slithyformis]AEI49527.1 YCII-related protein [Runella slithyformis DSM 19594]